MVKWLADWVFSIPAPFFRYTAFITKNNTKIPHLGGRRGLRGKCLIPVFQPVSRHNRQTQQSSGTKQYYNLQGEDASIFSSEIDRINALPEYPIKTAILIETLISNY
jgi:hypothetical protein